MAADIVHKLKDLDAAVHSLINAGVRAIILDNYFADMCDSLRVSTEADAAIGAFLSLKVSIEKSAALDLSASVLAESALPSMGTRQSFGLPSIEPA